MELAGSILDLNPKTKEEVLKLQNSGLDYIHLDVMDGKFVPNTSLPYDEVVNLIDSNQKLDVHLMVEDVEKYIDDFSNINPEYITFHLEVGNTLEFIQKLKVKNIKAGLSIKSNTNLDEIKPYLNLIDLVLVMSVEPGFGGQKFLENTLSRIDKLYQYRKENQLQYKIEVDGGINDQNIYKLEKCDMIVVGSFITRGNYSEQIQKLRGEL